ncbi:MAG TPA: N-acetylmuramidase domain-containing protein [Blastocatellia bacterium]|nr:N-acetylmuramidase domain-containing protein [Blastocatellia bacterium]
MPTQRTGTTTSNVNLRKGPGSNFDVITLLPNRTSVTILSESGLWYQITANNQKGFVHRDFVVLSAQRIPSGFFIQQAAPKTWPLAPSRSKTPPPDADAKTKQVARIWNKYGGLLQRLSERLRIDPGVAVAVIATESSGNGFQNGRMIIRFENHYFWRLWGKDNADRFRRHFSFNADEAWKGHQFRADGNAPWQEFHGNQDSEWNVFNKARSLNDEAAKGSISMGLPQIMGTNAKLIGYESAGEMFASFSKDERHQVLGLFDFIQGPETVSRRVIALQNQDFVAFAEQYNGPGQAAMYGGLLRLYFELFKLLN